MPRTTPATPEPTSALLYLRVSTGEQAREGVSLETQQRACRQYAVAHDWTIAREYQDILSGKRNDRPGYQALLADLRAAGAPKHVVVFFLDRLGRNFAERARVHEELEHLGVVVHSVREGTPEQFMSHVYAALAAEEVRRLGERVRLAYAHLAQMGWYRPGGQWAPWGYRYRPPTAGERAAGAPKAVLEPDPLAAPAVRALFRRVAAGETLRSAHRWVLTLPEAVRGGRSLDWGAFRRIVRKSLYAALSDSSSNLPRWEPLIDVDTWNHVQEQVDSHADVPHQATREYLLTGFIVCPRCGARMQGWMHTWRRPGYPREYRRANYRCRNQATCQMHVPARTIDILVRAALADSLHLLCNPAVGFRRTLERRWDAYWRPAPEATSSAQQRQALASRLEQLRSRERRATELFADGQIERPAYDDLLARARAERASLVSALEQLGDQPKTPRAGPPVSFATAMARLDDWKTALADGGVDLAAQRRVLAALIARVVPHPTPGWGNYLVQISWHGDGGWVSALANLLRETGDVAPVGTMGVSAIPMRTTERHDVERRRG
jgi:site-specific DNA recombinase